MSYETLGVILAILDLGIVVLIAMAYGALIAGGAIRSALTIQAIILATAIWILRGGN